MSQPPPDRRPSTRKVLIALILLTLACIPIALLILCTQYGKGAPPAEHPARAVLDRQVKCWNAGDLDGFMAGYWDSDKLTFFSAGTVTRGRKAVLARYRKRYQSEGKEMGKLTFSDLAVRQLGDADATATGRWKVITANATLEGLFTLVLHRFPDGWKIVHDHTSQAEAKRP